MCLVSVLVPHLISPSSSPALSHLRLCHLFGAVRLAVVSCPHSWLRRCVALHLHSGGLLISTFLQSQFCLIRLWLSEEILVMSSMLKNFLSLVHSHMVLLKWSARYLSKSHTPTEDSILAQRSTSTHTSNPIEKPLLSSSVLTQSAPVIKIKNTLSLVSALTFLGAFNLLKSPDTIIHSMVSKPRQQYVIYVGRKLF